MSSVYFELSSKTITSSNFFSKKLFPFQRFEKRYVIFPFDISKFTPVKFISGLPNETCITYSFDLSFFPKFQERYTLRKKKFPLRIKAIDKGLSIGNYTTLDKIQLFGQQDNINHTTQPLVFVFLSFLSSRLFSCHFQFSSSI